MADWWKKIVGKRGERGDTGERLVAPAGATAPAKAAWLGADDPGDPFSVDLLDLMVNQQLMATSSDRAVAERAMSWGASTGAELDIAPALECPAVECTMIDRALPDGLLFTPTSMHQKWAIAWRQGRVITVLALAGCGRLAFDATDARLGVVDSDGVADTGTFAAPVRELGDATREFSNPALTADGLEMFFVRRLPGGSDPADIYVVHRQTTNDPWDTPSPVVELNSTSNESGLHLSRDDLTMWFASARPGLGGHDIYTATRSTVGQAFVAPVLQAALSSAATESSPAVESSQLVYMDNFGTAPRDLREARRASTTSGWPTPVAIPELVDPADDAGPALSPDGLTLYFSSNRLGSFDLFVTSRPSLAEPFTTPVALDGVNTSFNESVPWISHDERTLYFASDRDGLLAIYAATR